MGAKRLGNHRTAGAGAATDLYAGVANGSTFNIKAVNDTGAQVTIKISISTATGTHQVAGLLVPDDFTLEADQTLDIGGNAIDAGEFVVVQAGAAGVVFTAMGVEA